MAGRPRMRELERDIENAGGWEGIMDRLADGESVGSVASSFGISRRYLYMWRDQPKHRDRMREAWAQAMEFSAEAEVERAQAEYDRLDRVIDVDALTGEEIRRVPLQAEIQLATGRAKFRQWLASKKDPARFGDKAQTEVNVSIGSMHLAALESVKARHALPAPEEEPEIIEAEVIE